MRTASAAYAGSEAALSAKGIYSESCGTGGSSTETWSGDGAVKPFDDNHPIQNGYGLVGWLLLDTINKTGALSLLWGSDDPNRSPFRITVRDCEGASTDYPVPLVPPLSPDSVLEFPSPVDPTGPKIPLLAHTFDMAGEWGVPGGAMTAPDGLATFEYIAARVEFAPDPDAARSRK